jgi:hypothetical protein
MHVVFALQRIKRDVDLHAHESSGIVRHHKASMLINNRLTPT